MKLQNITHTHNFNQNQNNFNPNFMKNIFS